MNLRNCVFSLERCILLYQQTRKNKKNNADTVNKKLICSVETATLSVYGVSRPTEGERDLWSKKFVKRGRFYIGNKKTGEEVTTTYKYTCAVVQKPDHYYIFILLQQILVKFDSLWYKESAKTRRIVSNVATNRGLYYYYFVKPSVLNFRG